MKRHILLLLFLGSALLAEEQTDPSLLFKAGFDNVTVTAEHAAGNRKSLNFPESLALRMYNGVGNKGNALSLTNRETVSYSNFRNHNPQKGTVSLWVASLNWKPSEKKFQIFFQSAFPNGCRFLIYKFINQSLLRFTIILKNKEIGYINVPLKNEDWAPGRWHKIDAVWDENMMALYLDGKRAKPLPYTKNPLIFRQKAEFPETVKNGSMSLGISKHFIHDPEHATAFDELEIYDRVLTPAEIQQNYEKKIPRADTDKRNEAEVPRGKEITLDGKLDPLEWQDAACFPILNPVKGARPGAHAQVYLKHNGNDLLIGAEIEGGEKQQITGNDLVDIWRDDSFEIHIFTVKKKRFQFIINSAGALFDADMETRSGVYDPAFLNPKWNCSARKAVRRENGKWTLEMAMPRKDIGAAGESLLVNFCATRYLDKASHVNWALNSKTFFDESKFGILHFTGPKKPVRMEKFGLKSGMFELKLNPEIPAWLLAADRTRSPRPAGQALWQVELPPGIYDFAASAKNFYYASRIAINQPLEIKPVCYASQKRLNITLDAEGAGSAVRELVKSGRAEAAVSLVSASGEKIISEKTAMRSAVCKLALQFRVVPPQGRYHLKAVILDAGKPVLEAHRLFRIPDMTPYKEKVADDHTVPAPWHPVKELGSGKFEVWNRIYTFEKGPFPVQIIAGGEKMLAVAPVLLLDGSAVQWKSSKVAEKFDDEIHFAGTGKAGEMEFSWKAALCFDGLVKIRIAMKPADGKEGKIRNLNLQWAVPRQYARAMLNPLYSKWRNKDDENYKFSYQHGEDFMIWTTGINKGLMWWIESPANWKNAPGHKQFSMTGKKDIVTVNADFITVPSMLKKTAEYSMAFMATPGRPEPARRRDFNPGQAWDVLKHETLKVQYYGIPSQPVDYATEPWTGLVPLNPEKFRKHIQKLEKQGTRYMPYSQPLMTASAEESYDWFFPEWKQIPGFPSGGGLEFKTGTHYDVEGCCGGTGAEDLFVWRAWKIMKDYPNLPGIYYDIAGGRLCSNTLHGCGGVDAFGKSYASSNLMKLRGYFIRIKRVLDSCGKDKILFLHAHNKFAPFVHGIGDYWYPGEQYANAITSNMEHFYCEDIPLGEFQSAYYTPVKGTGIVFNSIYQITQWRLKMKKKYAVPKYTFSLMAPLLLHDTNFSNCYLHHKTVERWWIIKHDINLADAEFHGYWFSDAVRSKSPKVLVSWYEWKKPSPYDRMLVVGNLGRNEQSAALQLDMRKLGLAGKKVSYHNLWTGEPIGNLAGLKVGPNNFLLVGIRIRK